MFDRITLKARAKLVLAGTYFPTLLACIIINFVSGGGTGFWSGKLQSINMRGMSGARALAIYTVAAFLILIALAVGVFVAGPLLIGFKKFLLKAAAGDANLRYLTEPFKQHYKNAVIIQFMKNLIVFLWGLLSFVPIIIGVWKFGLVEKLAVILNNLTADDLSWTAALISGGATVTGVMMLVITATMIFSIPSYIKALQYCMVEYIAAEDPEISWHEALDKSKELMVGNKWATVKLWLSFFGWYVVAFLLCCVGTVFVMPYVYATEAQLYLELIGRGGAYTSNDNIYGNGDNSYGGNNYPF